MRKNYVVVGTPLFLSFPTAQIKQRLGGAGKIIHYLYLGRDFKKRRQLEAELGANFVCLKIGNLLNEIADNLRNEHIAWIDQLNRRYGQEIEWWFGPIAARNVMASNLFQNTCYLEILERLWTDRVQRPELIFVESVGLLKAIQKWAIRREIPVEVLTNFMAWQVVKNYGFFILKLAHAAAILMARVVASYTSRKIYQPKDWPQGRMAIVDTFVHDFSLDQQGNFRDANFPGLNEYLAQNGLNVLVHPVLYGFGLNFFSIYRRLRRSHTHFIIAEDHLRGGDYLRALTYPFRAWRRKLELPRFRGFDLADLVKEDITKGVADLSSIIAVLIYRLFLILGDSALRPESVINWYENQVIDKALIMGVRRAFPQARIIGAQIFLYSLNLLYLFPTTSEAEAGVTPDVMLEMSNHLCDFAQTFTKAVPCRPAASLRYAYIFKRGEKMPGADGGTILILLPYEMLEALDILDRVKRVLDRLPPKLRLLVKCHPCYSSLTLKKAFGQANWPECLKFYQGSMQDALPMATLVISTNSATMAEAAAWGIPVIFPARQTLLNQNVLDGLSSNLVTKCVTEDDLVAGINKYLNLSPEERENYRLEGEQILKRYFSPINDETMLPFLGNF